MKSFKRRFAAFMAVVLVLTSFNMAWAKNTTRSGGKGDLQFSAGTGIDPTEMFELTVGDKQEIAVSLASTSEAVNITKVTVATGSNAVKATASDDGDKVLVSAEEAGRATVTVTAESDQTATGSEGNIVYKGSFTVVVTEKPSEPEYGLETDQEVVTITAGDPDTSKATIRVKATPSVAFKGDLLCESDKALNGVKITTENSNEDWKQVFIEAEDDAKEDVYTLTISAEVEGSIRETQVKLIVHGKQTPVVSGKLVLSAGQAILNPGESTLIRVTASPSNATVTELSAPWEDTSVIKVNTDTGKNEITITAATNAPDANLEIPVSAKVGGELQHTAILVKVFGQKVDDKVTGINVTFNGEPDEEYYVGQTIVAHAELLPAGAEAKVTWEASGIDVKQTVSENGMSAYFYAESAGKLTVKATAGGISNSAAATVKPIKAAMKFEETSVVLSGKGETYDFWKNLNIELLKPSEGDLHDDILADLEDSVVFTSSDKEIFDVNENGLGTAVKPGTVTVTAKIPANNLSAVCKVQILNDNTYQIVFDQVAMDFEDVNLIQKLTSKIYLVEEGKNPVEVTDMEKEGIEFKWVSSNTDIVTADVKGMITSVAAGKAVITAKAVDKSGTVLASQNCEVTVNKVKPVEDGAVVKNYQNDADVEAVLKAEDPSKVTKEQATAAAGAITTVIGNEDQVALLKNEKETTKVMDDISLIENALLLNSVISKPNFSIMDKRFTSIEADGLVLNALAEGAAAAGMKVDSVTVEVPQAIAGRTIDTSIAVDIQLTGISSLTVPVRIKLSLPAGYNSANTRVIHYGSRGMEIVPCTVSGGKVIFTVSDLSPFVIVKLQTTPDGGNGGGGSGSGGGSSSGRSTSSKQATSAIPETPGFWFETAAGWQFYTPDGTLYVNTWIYVNSHWYWIAVDGIMGQGWQQINGQWYYLTPGNGAMVTGWIPAQNIWYYTDTNGAMVTGWKQISNVWYYFGQDGIMLANGTTPDGYYVDANGAWVQ